MGKGERSASPSAKCEPESEARSVALECLSALHALTPGASCLNATGSKATRCAPALLGCYAPRLALNALPPPPFPPQGVPSGYFGNTAIPTNQSYNPDLCWRETGSDRLRDWGNTAATFRGYTDTRGMTSIRGKSFSTWVDYTSDFERARSLPPYSPCHGDSNIDGNINNAVGGGSFCLGTSSILQQHIVTIARYNENGPEQCYFSIPNTWGAEPSDVSVFIEGAGMNGFDVAVRFDGPMYYKWDVSAIEVYWVNEAKSVLLPVPSLWLESQGPFVRMSSLADGTDWRAPVGVRQTIMARLVINTPAETLAYPMGPFSPWAIRHFTIPKAAPYPASWLGAAAPVSSVGWTMGLPVAEDVVPLGKPLTIDASMLRVHLISEYNNFAVIDESYPQSRVSLELDVNRLLFDFSFYEVIDSAAGVSANVRHAPLTARPLLATKLNAYSTTASITVRPDAPGRVYAVRADVTVPTDLAQSTTEEIHSCWCFPTNGIFDHNPHCLDMPGGSTVDLSRCAPTVTSTFYYYFTVSGCAKCSPATMPTSAGVVYAGCVTNAVTQCKACVTCSAGSRITSACRQDVANVDTTCTLCTTQCPSYSRLTTLCSTGAGTVDNICTPCTPPPSNHYWSSGCTGNDAVDASFSPCPSNVNTTSGGYIFIQPGCPLVINGNTLSDALAHSGINLTRIAEAAVRATAAVAAIVEGGNGTTGTPTGVELAASLAAGGWDLTAMALNTTALSIKMAAALSALGGNLTALVADTVTALTAASAASAAVSTAAANSSAASAALVALGLNISTLSSQTTAALAVIRSVTEAASTAAAAAAATAGTPSALLNSLAAAGFNLTTLTASASNAVAAAVAAATAVTSGSTLAESLAVGGFNLTAIAAMAAAAADAAAAAAPTNAALRAALAAAGLDAGSLAGNASAAAVAAASAASSAAAAAAAAANVSAPALLLVLANAGFNLTALAASVAAATASGGARSFALCSSCLPGAQFLTRNCSTAFDVLCSTCALCSPGATYESVPCGPYTDRKCAPCTLTCPAGHFLSPCSATSPGFCTPWTAACPAGSRRVRAGNATHDIACGPCDCGAGAAACDAISGACTCTVNTVAAWAGPRCDACREGFFGAACDQRCLCDTSGAASMACARGDGACTCASRFAGFFCDRCNATAAGAQHFGADCAGVCGCAAGGSCVAGRAGTGACVCEAGWSGMDCGTAAGVGAGVFPGPPLVDAAALEGATWSWTLPRGAFAVVDARGATAGWSGESLIVRARDAAGAVVAAPSWISAISSGAAPAGWLLRGTPARGNVGVIRLVIVASEPLSGTTASAELRVTVTWANAPPRLSLPASAVTAARGVLPGDIWAVLLTAGLDANDTDIALGDVLTFDAPGAPTWLAGLAGHSDSGAQTWALAGTVPSDNAASSWTFAVRVRDAAGAGAELPLTITIKEGGAALAAVPQEYEPPPPVAITGTAFTLAVPASLFRVDPAATATLDAYTVSITSYDRTNNRPALVATGAADLPLPPSLPSCAWLSAAIPGGSPPLPPLLYGTPSAHDVATSCIAIVTAVNTAGSRATATLAVQVANPRAPPRAAAFFLRAPPPPLIAPVGALTTATLRIADYLRANGPRGVLAYSLVSGTAVGGGGGGGGYLPPGSPFLAPPTPAGLLTAWTTVAMAPMRPQRGAPSPSLRPQTQRITQPHSP